MVKLYINNENFTQSIKAMMSESFERPQFVIQWDKLNKENKKFLEEKDLPKTNLTILTKDSKGIPKKYKHQIQIEKFFEKDNIVLTLKHLFKNGNREQVKIELDKFENRHLLTWLESTSTFYPELAIKTSGLEKYVYSPHFKDLLLYNLEGINCLPQFVRRQ